MPGGRVSLVVKRKLLVGAVVCTIALAAAFAFAPAFASAATSKAVLEANKARIMTELDAMRVAMQERMDEFASTGRDMQETQTEIDQVGAQLAEVETELANSKRGLSLRAAELYRGEQIGMIDVLLSSQNIEDLIVRTHYLMLISQRDANALEDARLMQSESLWLRDSLNRRIERIRGLQAKADAERARIQTDITKAETRAASIDVDLAELLRQSQTPVPGDTSGSINYDTILTDANFRSQDMTATGVQAFLDRQPGPLKTYYAKDHAGVRKSAAEIIADAAKYYHVSPRVILVTLQKEQSLLSKKPRSSYGYDWAMGCGRPDSGAMILQYKGFGNQVWGGAQKFDKWAKVWRPGTTMSIDSSTVTPTNGATFAQYKYTPHLRGVTSFWTLWIRYFNDNPAN
jgi:peptidoglycan hydrolase CwlO-like protein